MKTALNNVQNNNPAELRPGIYRNRNGNQRLLFAVINRRCIHGMGDINSRFIHLTTCSSKTFIESAGMKFIRKFTAEEIASVKTKFVPLAFRRTANNAERGLFFRLQGMEKLIEAMDTETSMPKAETPIVAEEIEHKNQKANWYMRLFAWFLDLFSTQKHGLEPVVSKT